MPYTYEWVDTQVDRSLERQRGKSDNSKLVATFAAGIAVTIFATALQVGTPASDLEHEAWPWMMLSAGLAVAVVLLDRLREVDYRALLQYAHFNGWDEPTFVHELRWRTMEVVRFNDWTIRIQQWVLVAQIFCSIRTGNLAAASLLA